MLESIRKAVTEGADYVLDYRIVRPDGVVDATMVGATGRLQM